MPRTVKHICHEEGVKYEPCLAEIYRLHMSLVEVFAKNGNVFYYKASKALFGFENVPVGVNTLNKVLPDLCKAAGVKRKTAHDLRVTCASSLFNAGVEESLYVSEQDMGPMLYYSMINPARKIKERYFICWVQMHC